MYYILALDKTQQSDQLVWCRPNDAGYTIDLKQAGIYTEQQVNDHRLYYDNEETHPIKVDDVKNEIIFSVVMNDTDHFRKIGALDKYKKYINRR